MGVNAQCVCLSAEQHPSIHQDEQWDAAGEAEQSLLLCFPWGQDRGILSILSHPVPSCLPLALSFSLG